MSTNKKKVPRIWIRIGDPHYFEGNFRARELSIIYYFNCGGGYDRYTATCRSEQYYDEQ
jgi:hypothetical protein